ncbi:MAG: ubiquitin-like small modifier protein 1 [Vulcanimicrobiota bacterium]
MTVKFFAFIRDYTNTKETDIENCNNVEDLLKKLCTIYGRKFESRVFPEGELSREIIILVNGHHIAHHEGVHTKLSAEDEISIFPTVAGG